MKKLERQGNISAHMHQAHTHAHTPSQNLLRIQHISDTCNTC